MNLGRGSPSRAPRSNAQTKRSKRTRLSNAASDVTLPTGASSDVRERRTRVVGLDALRGVAIVAKVIYHFCFDRRYFGVTRWDFEHDLVWLTARSMILSSFLLIAGISTALARRNPDADARLPRHVAMIGSAALLVTAVSWRLFPQSFIWFGVLHAIAVSLLLARPLCDRPRLAAIVGVIVIVAGVAFAPPAFDGRALGWIGFVTHKPVTEVYVPLFPWAGVLYVGLAAGLWLVRARFAVLAPLAHAPAALQWMGRHSLGLYLIHQPLLIGALWLALRR
jgi:uncharacterized membrane protein